MQVCSDVRATVIKGRFKMIRTPKMYSEVIKGRFKMIRTPKISSEVDKVTHLLKRNSLAKFKVNFSEVANRFKRLLQKPDFKYLLGLNQINIVLS